MSKVCRIGLPLSLGDSKSIIGLKSVLNAYSGKEQLLFKGLLHTVYGQEVYSLVKNGNIYTKAVRLNKREQDTLRTLSELTELPQTRVSALLIDYYQNHIDVDTERAGKLIEELTRLGYQVKIVKEPK